MGQVYTQHDIDLRQQAKLKISFLNDAGAIVERPVIFQFPPRILSDNRKGNWRDEDLRGNEPVSVFATSGPREIALSWTYIIDGKDFTPTVVADQIKLVRGYFAAVKDTKKRSRNLIVDFQYILYGSDDPVTARIKAVDVKHGDTIVSQAGNIFQSFPLRTDITVELRLWTKGGVERVQDLEGLYDKLTPAWY